MYQQASHRPVCLRAAVAVAAGAVIAAVGVVAATSVAAARAQVVVVVGEILVADFGADQLAA